MGLCKLYEKEINDLYFVMKYSNNDGTMVLRMVEYDFFIPKRFMKSLP